jgi:hypothetical protein
MRPRQSRNNNGQACGCGVRFCGNAADGSDSLLDDLLFVFGSVQDQQLTGKEQKHASITGESTACKIKIESRNSYEIYIAGRPLSRPLQAFCLPDGPQPWPAKESRPRGILSALEGIPASGLHAHRRSSLADAKMLEAQLQSNQPDEKSCPFGINYFRKS